MGARGAAGQLQILRSAAAATGDAVPLPPDTPLLPEVAAGLTSVLMHLGAIVDGIRASDDIADNEPAVALLDDVWSGIGSASHAAMTLLISQRPDESTEPSAGEPPV